MPSPTSYSQAANPLIRLTLVPPWPDWPRSTGSPKWDTLSEIVAFVKQIPLDSDIDCAGVTRH